MYRMTTNDWRVFMILAYGYHLNITKEAFNRKTSPLTSKLNIDLRKTMVR